MENNRTSFGENIFAKAFQQFDEQSFFENLNNKVRNKSYYEQYRGFKNTIVALSYLFNIASMLTASYAIFWLTDWLTGMVWLSYAIAAVFLFFLEQLKRKSSNEFFQVWFFRKQFAFGWLILSLFCLSISLASSAFGTKTGTEELAPNAALLQADSLMKANTARIGQLEADNTWQKKQKNSEGQTYYKSLSAIKANKATIGDLEAYNLELQKKLDGKNDLLSDNHKQKVQLTSSVLVAITLLMELLFEACIAYIWYFYFRIFVERNSTISTPPPPKPSLQADTTTLLEELHFLRQEVKRLSEQITINPSNTSPPNIPEPSENGVHNTSAATNIGFFSAAQKAEMKLALPLVKNCSVHACTDVYREKKYEDRYTISHSYTKQGQLITVHYTLPQIEARIGQYEREIAEAEQRQLKADVLENRQMWLNYWRGKKKEILNKRQSVKAQ